ncbi:MAG: bifunctional phosphoglucose/phosphomannose isomerase [Balneolaceae bacterium]|nr:bifunctional phosphoglucose/phosphomannose isomerase [Balneolaceae bacterium]
MAEVDRKRIESVDTQNMWELLSDFPAQWRESVSRTESLDLTIDASRIRSICLAGMGGSAIGADLVRAYSYHTCPHPVQVVRHYDIPAWVDEHTLFISCSFSGNTEETLSALGQAREQGAQTIGVTSGGDLLRRASREEFDIIQIPGGMPPRAALGYSFVPLWRIFRHLDYLGEGEGALEETAHLLEEQAEMYRDLSDNEALQLAEDLNDTLPVIYSDALLMEPVNLRWRGQFGENAKTLAYGNTLPEMNHNEIVGWERVVHLTGRLSVIMLVDKEDKPRVRRRMEIVEELVADQTTGVHRLTTRGKSRLARMFSLVQMGDWTSYYLALINGVDPTPIAKIDLLKSRLAES